MARHVRQGDMVIVVSGDGAYQRRPDGSKVRDASPHKVLRVLPEREAVVVEGVNLHKKHVRRSQQNQQGGVYEKELPIHWSNVQPADAGRPTRVRFEKRADGAKIRVSARSGEQLGGEIKKARR